MSGQKKISRPRLNSRRFIPPTNTPANVCVCRASSLPAVPLFIFPSPPMLRKRLSSAGYPVQIPETGMLFVALLFVCFVGVFVCCCRYIYDNSIIVVVHTVVSQQVRATTVLYDTIVDEQRCVPSALTCYHHVILHYKCSLHLVCMHACSISNMYELVPKYVARCPHDYTRDIR